MVKRKCKEEKGSTNSKMDGLLGKGRFLRSHNISCVGIEQGAFIIFVMSHSKRRNLIGSPKLLVALNSPRESAPMMGRRRAQFSNMTREYYLLLLC